MQFARHRVFWGIKTLIGASFRRIVSRHRSGCPRGQIVPHDPARSGTF